MKEAVRQVLKRGFRGLALGRNYFGSPFRSRNTSKQFDSVETYLIFVGYPKSGHSLVGSLLDAHPNAVVSHELDALACLRSGIGREELYRLILKNSRRFSREGRRWSKHSYNIPRQWQGRYEEIKVIGDKKGGRSTLHLDADPSLLSKLRDAIGVPIKFIHIVRNPYDNIAAMFRDGVHNPNMEQARSDDLPYAIKNYFHRCEAMSRFVGRVSQSELIELRHEAFVENPRLELGRLCSFLGLDASEDYLRDCASVVFEAPTRTRHKVSWDVSSIEHVKRRMEDFPFLKGYSFEE